MVEKRKGRVALVTGGGSGIGQATALAFSREGTRVVVADVSVEGGQETVHHIKKAGGEAIFVKCDVSKAAEVKGMIDRTVEVYGSLDCAFNNAGIDGELKPIVDYREDIWNQVISINLTGVWLCMKYEIPQMLKQGGGVIVNTASVAGLIGTAGLSAYTAAKHGVVGITKTVALEYAKSSIRVNAVCPGAIRTPMVDHLCINNPEMEKFFLEAHPVGRLGYVDEVAGAVIWLCSDSASFITGHSMAIDGGLTAR